MPLPRKREKAFLGPWRGSSLRRCGCGLDRAPRPRGPRVPPTSGARCWIEGWIQRRVGEWAIEDHRRRRGTGGNGECFDAEDPPDMLDSLPIIVGLDIRLIPRKPKRCFGHLDYKEIEIGIRRQTARVDRHVFGRSRRHQLDARPGARKTVFAPADTTMSNEISLRLPSLPVAALAAAKMRTRQDAAVVNTCLSIVSSSLFDRDAPATFCAPATAH